MLTTSMKRIVFNVYQQLMARRNLYHLRDKRAFSVRMGSTLRQAAEVWPVVLPRSPKTILDIGAHDGSIAGQLTELYKPEFMGLVEPQPDLVAKLQGKSFASRERVFACAVGRSNGLAKLNILESTPSTSLLEVAPGCDEIFHRSMAVKQIIDVPVRTLDDIFDECKLLKLDLLKVDVQGYELEVFAGGKETLRGTRTVVCEVSFFEHYVGQPLFPDIYLFLTAMGFAMHGTFGYLYDGRGQPLQCDAVFVNVQNQ